MPAPVLASDGVYIGVGALWVVLFIVFGILCLRKGHWVMFLIGIFIPLFWLIGAVIPGRR